MILEYSAHPQTSHPHRATPPREELKVRITKVGVLFFDPSTGVTTFGNRGVSLECVERLRDRALPSLPAEREQERGPTVRIVGEEKLFLLF